MCFLSQNFVLFWTAPDRPYGIFNVGCASVSSCISSKRRRPLPYMLVLWHSSPSVWLLMWCHLDHQLSSRIVPIVSALALLCVFQTYNCSNFCLLKSWYGCKRRTNHRHCEWNLSDKWKLAAAPDSTHVSLWETSSTGECGYVIAVTVAFNSFISCTSTNKSDKSGWLAWSPPPQQSSN